MPKNIHPNPFILRPPADLVTQKPELRRWSAKLSQKYVDKQVVTDAELKAIGGALWDALGADEKFDAARKAAGNAILPIIVESEAADVQALPWEILHHPALGFLGKHPAFTLTRRAKAPEGDAPPVQKGPLRVLLFTSLPDDVHPEQGRLDVEEEQAQVQDALLPWIAKGLVRLEMPDDGRFETFKGWLRDFDPHVVFLSGHGKFYGEAHREEKFGAFYFEDETGKGLEVREEALAEAFIGSNVQLVVLSACESEKSASDLLNNGLTRRLSAQGIPHVIGMRESVLDQAGIRFARALCDELARAERVDCALQAARIAIQQPFKGSDVTRREAGAAAADELSYGQWSLPAAFSPRPEAALIEWDFAPQAVEIEKRLRLLSNVSLPPRFIGRRAELRQRKSALLAGTTRQLLITGPGGQGKTALAGKLAQDLQKEGWKIFAWSIRPENRWKDFEFEMERTLDEPNAKKFDFYRPRFESDAQRAKFLLDLLAEQFGGRLVLFLDNLESVQDGDSLAVTDPAVAAWLEAVLPSPTGRGAGGEGILLVTSRWSPPNWAGERLELGRVTYGDFLQIARQRLPAAFWQNRERMRRAYAALGGNPRGLEFLAAAVKDMDAAQEDAFLAALAQTKADVQANMALDAIYARLPAEAQTLLRRLPAYHEPVPAEGILKLALAGAERRSALTSSALLERLLAVSLLEVSVPARVGRCGIRPAAAGERLAGGERTDPRLAGMETRRRRLPPVPARTRTGRKPDAGAHDPSRPAPRAAERRSRPPHPRLYRGSAYDGRILHRAADRLAAAHLRLARQANPRRSPRANGKTSPSPGKLSGGLTLPETVAGDQAANRRQSGGGDDAQQYFADFQGAGRLRDGARLPETVARHTTANRRQSGAVRHAVQYGAYLHAK